MMASTSPLLTKNITSSTIKNITNTQSTNHYEIILEKRELTSSEKEIQKKFAIIVGVCFSMFLFLVIGYVTFMQLKKLRRNAIERRRTEENLEKPTLTRRTSMVGQGQKQIVIERRTSTTTTTTTPRKISSNSIGSTSTNQQQRMFRLSSSGHSFDFKSQPGIDRLIPPSPNSTDEKFSFSLYPTDDNFFNAAIVRYGNKTTKNNERKECNSELQDLIEKSLSEKSDDEVSSFTKDLSRSRSPSLTGEYKDDNIQEDEVFVFSQRNSDNHQGIYNY